MRRKFLTGRRKSGSMRTGYYGWLVLAVLVVQTPSAGAQTTAQKPSAPDAAQFRNLSSQECVRKGWEYSSHGDIKKLSDLTNACVESYGKQADREAAQLKAFPALAQDRPDPNQTMDDVATLLFIRAEATMREGKIKQAIVLFEQILKKYKWAQAWDPRGWYWSVAKKSETSINNLKGTGRTPATGPLKPVKIKLPRLSFPGTEKVVDYPRYGTFMNPGTKDYHYSIIDFDGLRKVVGEGLYPNSGQYVGKDKNYKKALRQGRLKVSHWSILHGADLEAAFYKWVFAPEPEGVRLFYLGLILERSHLYFEAIKAYQSLVVNFPETVSWTIWGTPWYPARVAVYKIRYLVRIHPDLGLEVKDMDVKILNSFDNKTGNDIFLTSPGTIRLKAGKASAPAGQKYPVMTPPPGQVKRTIGNGKVRLVQYENKHWQMLVDGRPYFIKGISYAPTRVGESPDSGSLVSWMVQDLNHNGKADGPYDSWVDTNRNNRQDKDEPVIGDFQLMKDLGVNTIRLYAQSVTIDKQLLRRLYQDFGIRVMMGNFLGKYAIGSGATWFQGTDYTDLQQQKNMLEAVRKMVLEYKDEPYLLMWVLGNENNYGVASNADQAPDAYFQFADKVARLIKSLDPDHPVALCNGDTLFLDIFAKDCPNIDIFAANAYRGDYGFGSFWQEVADLTGKPALITEFGCPAFSTLLTEKQRQSAQADYLEGNWVDIADNSAGHEDGVGNALGGFVFEWTDEWWKQYSPYKHDTEPGPAGPFPGDFYFEEWFGLTSQGNGEHSPFLRQLRTSYFTLQKLWKK